MAKKKIIYVLYSLGIGGVEKSLLSMLGTMDPNLYDIHVAVLGEDLSLGYLLPKHVTLHRIGGYQDVKRSLGQSMRANIIDRMRKLDFTGAVRHGRYMLVDKVLHNRLPYLRHLAGTLSKIEGHFDEAHAYAGPSEIIDCYVHDMIDADEKYGWVHFDISKFGVGYGSIRRLYPDYSGINVVSRQAKDVFDNIFPELASKTAYRPNIIDKETILRMAADGESFDDGFSGIRLLTVGRLSPEKGQDIAVEALAKIVKERTDVKWYFIGDGPWKDHCMRRAEESGISAHTVFLGSKTNPYPYMRDCDLYVQTSRHEGFCITLGEAIALDRPIVSTDFCGANEQLAERADAMICPPDADAMAHTILKSLRHTI